MLKIKSPQALVFLSFVLSALFYFYFAYFLVRTDIVLLIILYAALFLFFYKLVKISRLSFRTLTIMAILLRLVFLFSIPNLSQDFYRFIWDGRMILEGYNPYLYTPQSFIDQGIFPVQQALELFNGMGALSAGHFTNYPPINQLCFVIAGLFSDNSILGSAIVLRIIIIAADLGSLYFGKKLLKKLNIPVKNIFWYILNPFIIIELTGNLHFEGVMIFFLIWSLHLLHSGKWKTAAVVFALSVSTKLIPLIFLPLFYQYFTTKNTISYKTGVLKLLSFYGIVLISSLLLFLPFFSMEFVQNYTKTVGLWFQNFEFNASLYYIAREIGYLFRGWNEIAIIGKIIPLVVILFVLVATFVRKNKSMVQLITAMLLVLSFYYFTATTVHPWYIATLLFLSIFTRYKFPLVWSFVIVFSYLAYANSNNTENLWIIALEYFVVYVVVIKEVLFKNKDYLKVGFSHPLL
ncbi:mannosyltransferase [Aureibaculum sp. 2210JD6-5]|uniref:mannosyltransferase n=1 Tax=Aureibaculum sp. 2210JD6-5 TaxID=3103957 RepID=UPI002AAE1CBE|nr:mannosyltransferase [Aureibaculum sp. 2210JD6-5]MDY7395131.1 mannosyltransferase [Aureibaculum sp. 2210JD6-5]